MITYERYAEIRDSKNLKDGRVAELAGIGRSTFSDWKSGRSVPKEDKLKKIANVLNLPLLVMLGFDEMSDELKLESVEKELGKDSKEYKLMELYNSHKGYSMIPVSTDEYELISQWRNADEETKNMIVRILAFNKNENADNN